MRLPVLRGLIRRRLLVSFRVDPEVGTRLLPAPFRLKLHGGYGIASICLIRLEEIRARWVPRMLGLSSENAAHRIAVTWDEASGEPRDGVFIPRRDTSSWLNHATGGRILPGEQNRADFAVTDDGEHIDMSIRARDGSMAIALSAWETDDFPTSSCFDSLADSSAFFQSGSIGYSSTSDCCRFDGMRLESHGWGVRPLAMDRLESSFFDDRATFPEGSIAFDHAIIMRNLSHEWHGVADLNSGAAAPVPACAA